MAARSIRSGPLPEIRPEQFYRTLADTIPHIVWSARADGHDDYGNRRLYEYTGLIEAELAGRGWESIVHPDDLERCRARWRQALSRGERFEIEYRLRRRDGAYLWHLGAAEPVREGGRIVRWFGTCTEIEARKHAERLLEQSRRTLEVLVDSRSGAAEQSVERAALSPREQQVLRRTVEGLTIAQTARQLGVSPKSVETYRSRAMMKLGVVDLPGLVKFAIRNGITTI
jgi:PAS domain S-box-containing protein